MKKYIEKEWGYEIWFADNNLYSGKELYCVNTWSSKGRFHYHKMKDETFYIIDGELNLEFKDNRDKIQSIILFRGETFRINPLVKHRFKAVKNECYFIEVATPIKEGGILNDDSYYEDEFAAEEHS